MNSEIYLGSHISLGGPNYFVDTVNTAIRYGENTFMFYTGAPQNSVRVPLEKCKIPEGLALLKQSNIDLTKVVVHAPYIINIGNTLDKSKFDFAVSVLSSELKRTAAFGVKTLVLHPGSSVGGDETESLNQIVHGLDEVFSNDNSDVVIALETMAGKGSELGKTFEQIAYIIKNCKYSNRLGVCLDTCHINDGGYDVNDEDKIISEFDKIIGLNRLKVIHLNDSKNIKGSHKDRHENIGFGEIGFETLIKYVFDPRLKDVPKILETPYIDGYPPYKMEIEMIKSKKFDDRLKEKILAEKLI
jgi:deoxyribonuclease-4